jgi:hypothetical protein
MAKCNIPQAQLDAYAAHIRADYVKWWGPERLKDKHIQEMIAEFQIEFEVGSSYIKVVKAGNNRSVHSFIVNKDGKFPKGTVLKSASWKAPATNFGRAHIAHPDSWVGHVSWTGAN